MSDLLWKPSAERVQHSEMTRFINWLASNKSLHFNDYHALHKWSIDNLQLFWETFLEYSKIKFSQKYSEILSSNQMPGAEWFRGMKLNFAENILLNNFQGTAIRFVIETPFPGNELKGSYSGEVSFQKLKRSVAQCIAGLKNSGIKKGDKVAGYLANIPEAIVAAISCSAIGAVWSSASPDFGLEALCERFNQVEPKIIFASTHYVYNGKIYSTGKVVGKLKDHLPSVEKIIDVPYPVGQSEASGDISWQDFLETNSDELFFEQLPFNHPLYIMFSSGTTGKPKCIIHSAGGVLLQHFKEQKLHCNITEGDSLLYFTTCGWMMWNWQLTALGLGATLVLYDGSPAFPETVSLWKTADRLKVTHLGTSGRYIESSMKIQPEIKKGELGSFNNLKTILYTGSPLSKKGFKWIYDIIKSDTHLAGISGGTDIISCFVLGNPNLPVYAGQIQCKGLGIDVAVYDEAGNEIHGKPGELVCRKPIPSMPLGFLNDPDGSKYFNAYFNFYPGVWRHGDYMEFLENDGCIIYGRSDATLNPGGVRIGCSEIYSSLEDLEYIKSVVASGWVPPGQSDEIIILFVVLNDSKKLDDETIKEIKAEIKEKTSPRHTPAFVFQIKEIPVTRSGKTVELTVKLILAGKSPGNENALSNPHVLKDFEMIRQRLLQQS